MSVETERGQAGIPWGAPLDRWIAGPRGAAVRGADMRGPAVSLRRDALYRRMLLLADVLAALVVFLSTMELASRSLRLTWALTISVPVLILGAKVSGLYDRDETLLRKTTLEEAPKLFQLATLCALISWLVGGPIAAGNIDRREGLFLWLALAGGLIVARAAARALALWLAPAERCLFIGDDTAAAAILPRLDGHSGVRTEVVAHLDLDMAAPWASDGASAARLGEVRDLARTLDVHRAIVAPGWSIDTEPDGVLNLVRTLKAVGVRVSVLPRMLEVVGSAVEFDDLHGVTLMGVRRFDLTRSSAKFKRALDLLGATIGLLAVAPLMLAIALAIKLDARGDRRGPVFFRQQRVGRHGQRFYMLKFRSMVPDAEELKDALRDSNEARDGLFKIAEDPRVTRVGRVLRRSALDELPQLFNVLRGEMSLVGPRPLVLEEDRRVEGWNRRRLELTPGMTGPWQILGPTRVPLSEMVAIDYMYVANWSLWTDLKILLRTVPHVLCRRGL